jgi:hypothetical protein
VVSKHAESFAPPALGLEQQLHPSLVLSFGQLFVRPFGEAHHRIAGRKVN